MGTEQDFGSVLTSLGARTSDAAVLSQAEEAYREALKEWTRERAPMDWAMTQSTCTTR